MPTAEPIRIIEVGPRDGLQQVAEFIPTDRKIAFVDALSESGLREIEVSSFVSPAWVPQLADAEAVFAAAELVVKVKEPQPQEWARLGPGHILAESGNRSARPTFGRADRGSSLTREKG